MEPGEALLVAQSRLLDGSTGVTPTPSAPGLTVQPVINQPSSARYAGPSLVPVLLRDGENNQAAEDMTRLLTVAQQRESTKSHRPQLRRGQCTAPVNHRQILLIASKLSPIPCLLSH